MHLQTIISVSGYGFSGSGAVKDLLMEFPNVSSSSAEFQLLYFPDGIADLDWKLNVSCNRFHDSDIALKRFLSLCREFDDIPGSFLHQHLYPLALEYIKSLTMVSWEGGWYWDQLKSPNIIQEIDNQNEIIFKKNAKRRLINQALRKLGIKELPMLPWKTDYYPKRKMRLSIMPPDFLKITRKFMSDIINLANPEHNSIFVFDQLTPPATPQRYHKYFSQKIKSISVNRDPRDLFIFAKIKDVPYIAHDSVDNFIIWYAANNQPAFRVPHEDVLYLRFEDLIYEYNATVDTIKQFVGIEGITTKEFFNPAISAVNTQLFSKYPEFSNDIAKITEKLKSYLYDFDAHRPIEVDQNAEIF